jgi:membrane-associated PAP2 superfamily phosphatase
VPANDLRHGYAHGLKPHRQPYWIGFPFKAAMALLVSAIIILWLGNYTNFDLQLADLFYDPRRHTFPWRHNWFAVVIVHNWLKYLIMAPALLLMAFVLVDTLRPFSAISAFIRVRLRVVALSALLIPSVISLMKCFSAMECPWDLERYGGHSPYLRLLDIIPSGWQAGHCFPAGYASAGLWLAAIAVFWLPAQPAKAMRVFLAGLGVGIFLGLVQQVRGAHFMTHTLWSVWITSAILLIIYAFHAKQLNRTSQAGH